MTTTAFNLGSDNPISEETPEEWGNLVDEFDDNLSTGEDDSSEVTDDLEETASDDDETPPEGDEAGSEDDDFDDDEEGADDDEPTEESEDDDTTDTEEVKNLLEIPESDESIEEEPTTVVPPTPEEVNAQREQYQSQLREAYAISEEDLERFEDNPGEVLPEFAANLHMKIVESTMNQISQMLPNAVQQITIGYSTIQQSEDAFFDAWPELTEHASLVTTVAEQYRTLNPDASAEDAISAVGMNALLQLGVSPQDLANRMAGNVQEEVTPEPEPKPHVPVGVGRTSSRGEETPPTQTLWSEMIEDS